MTTKMCFLKFSTDLLTLRQGQGHSKWHRMVKVNITYKHSKHKSIWFQKFSVKDFATQDS